MSRSVNTIFSRNFLQLSINTNVELLVFKNMPYLLLFAALFEIPRLNLSIGLNTEVEFCGNKRVGMNPSVDVKVPVDRWGRALSSIGKKCY